MSEVNRPISGFLPHLIVLTILLVLEYWIFMSHASMLAIAGDYGDIVGIVLVLTFAITVIVVLGLYSICGDKPWYKRIVSIGLILFIVQMALIFFEYVFIAMSTT